MTEENTPINLGDEQESGFIVNPEILAIQDAGNKIKESIAKIIIGQDNMLRLMINALITGGHVLVEGVPGIAKTLTARLIAKSLDTDFSRIQFTPDLMPSDIIGTSIFNMKNSEFTFKKGPIFSNIILIDEINRSPAKTQSALFEVMEERSISVDGVTHPLQEPFFVVATQNPIEQEGTYRLPEAQLDRFLFRIKVDYPDLEEEKQILDRFKEDFGTRNIEEITPVMSGSEIIKMREAVQNVRITSQLIDYIAMVVHETRNNGDLFLGASPRASLAIMMTAKVNAALEGRDFVTPEDIKIVAAPVLNHRLILTPERELEGVEVETIIDQILERIEIPR